MQAERVVLKTCLKRCIQPRYYLREQPNECFHRSSTACESWAGSHAFVETTLGLQAIDDDRKCKFAWRHIQARLQRGSRHCHHDALGMPLRVGGAPQITRQISGQAILWEPPVREPPASIEYCSTQNVGFHPKYESPKSLRLETTIAPSHHHSRPGETERLSFAYFILPYWLERMLAGFPCLVNRRRIAVLSFRLHDGE